MCQGKTKEKRAEKKNRATGTERKRERREEETKGGKKRKKKEERDRNKRKEKQEGREGPRSDHGGRERTRIPAQNTNDLREGVLQERGRGRREQILALDKHVRLRARSVAVQKLKQPFTQSGPRHRPFGAGNMAPGTRLDLRDDRLKVTGKLARRTDTAGTSRAGDQHRMP